MQPDPCTVGANPIVAGSAARYRERRPALGQGMGAAAIRIGRRIDHRGRQTRSRLRRLRDASPAIAVCRAGRRSARKRTRDPPLPLTVTWTVGFRSMLKQGLHIEAVARDP